MAENKDIEVIDEIIVESNKKNKVKKMNNEMSAAREVDSRLPDEPFRDWCKRRGFSVAKGYAMIKAGTAPRTIQLPGCRSRTVTPAADAEWEAKYCTESTIDPEDSQAARDKCRGA